MFLRIRRGQIESSTSFSEILGHSKLSAAQVGTPDQLGNQTYDATAKPDGIDILESNAGRVEIRPQLGREIEIRGRELKPRDTRKAALNSVHHFTRHENIGKIFSRNLETDDSLGVGETTRILKLVRSDINSEVQGPAVLARALDGGVGSSIEEFDSPPTEG